MTYNQLDAIADAYIPILAIVSALIIVRETIVYGLCKARINASILLSCSIVAYGLMFLDQWCDFWPAMGLDYSTHTAIAWVFVVFLFDRTKTTKYINLLQAFIVLSMGAYIVLMLFQKYHSVLDIVSTSVVMVPTFVFLKNLNRKLI